MDLLGLGSYIDNRRYISSVTTTTSYMHISLGGVQSITGMLNTGTRTPAILERKASLSTATKENEIAKFRGLVACGYRSKNIDAMVHGSFTYVFIIRVMLSPFKSILPANLQHRY